VTEPILTVLKVGGELLETPADLRAVVSHAAVAAAAGPLVIVHGGGRELSAELTRRGAAPRMVDGIRVTDDEALAAAVSVLAGTINTRLVAALATAGVRAVGLTGADGALLRARRSPAARSRAGQRVDLGHVGIPVPSSDTALLRALCAGGFVPVVASIGITGDGALLNVNADVAASHLAVSLGAERLLVLGGTDGVLDADGRTIPALSREEADALIDAGAATDGMAAKLAACVHASARGVAEVRIASGRDAPGAAASGTAIARGTRVAASGMARAS
jgi:acetylglutamate kinase